MIRKVLIQIVVGVAAFSFGVSAVRVIKTLWYTPDAEQLASVTPPPRFSRMFESCGDQSCGKSYIQAWDSNDGQWLWEGLHRYSSEDEALKRFHNEVDDALTVIEVHHQNHNGSVTDRFIGEYRPNDMNDKSVRILIYTGGRSYRFIEAPTLDLALEFEQYLISIDDRC